MSPESKYKAIDEFRDYLLSSPAGDSITRIVLFGSLLRGEATEESDIDLMVISDLPEEVSRVCAEASFEIMLRTGEGIEPIVHCLDEWRRPASYLIYRVKKIGKEIYQMKEEEIKYREASGYLQLAETYLEGAKRNLAVSDWRISIDAAYNAAELCVKGLLLFVLDEMPSSHRGVVNRFGELYIKSGQLERELGRGLNQALYFRNQARYEPHPRIGKEEAKIAVDLAQQLIDTLSSRLENKP